MSQENIPVVDLAPVAAARLKGRTRKRGKTVTVTDSTGAAVVKGTVGRAAAPAAAVLRMAEGRWRVEDGDSGVAILDWKRRPVATAHNGEVVLQSGERLLWRQSNLPVRYRLGDDLWVAKASWRSRRFAAVLSPALLAREDRALLVGIASILTQAAVERRRGLLGGAAGFGASWG